MHRHIELCGYDTGGLLQARQEIGGIRSPLARCSVWDDSLLEIGVVPDVSVIDARGKDWQDVVRLVNEAHSHRIVLLGSQAPRIGLQVVPTASRLEEAIDEALRDGGLGDGRAPDTLPSPLAEQPA